jgi:hypothetical protein
MVTCDGKVYTVADFIVSAKAAVKRNWADRADPMIRGIIQEDLAYIAKHDHSRRVLKSYRAAQRREQRASEKVDVATVRWLASDDDPMLRREVSDAEEFMFDAMEEIYQYGSMLSDCGIVLDD